MHAELPSFQTDDRIDTVDSSLSVAKDDRQLSKAADFGAHSLTPMLVIGGFTAFVVGNMLVTSPTVSALCLLSSVCAFAFTGVHKLRLRDSEQTAFGIVHSETEERAVSAPMQSAAAMPIASKDDQRPSPSYQPMNIRLTPMLVIGGLALFVMGSAIAIHPAVAGFCLLASSTAFVFAAVQMTRSSGLGSSGFDLVHSETEARAKAAPKQPKFATMQGQSNQAKKTI